MTDEWAIHRGGKVVMALALDPALPKDLLSRLIVVDISPAVGPISPEFRRYIDAMKEIDAAKVQTKKEGEEILKNYESVSAISYPYQPYREDFWGRILRPERFCFKILWLPPKANLCDFAFLCL
jgi:hypothetical protein